VLVAVLFGVAGIWVSGMDGYVLTASADVGAAMSPLQKTAELQAGAWLQNYSQYPLAILAPVVGFAGLLLASLFSLLNRGALAFVGSSLAQVGVIMTAGVSLFPFIMPSSLNPSHSLTVWDVVSSELTLNIMFWVAMVFVPIVLSYTAWGYYKMRGRLTTDFIEQNKYSTY